MPLTDYEWCMNVGYDAYVYQGVEVLGEMSYDVRKFSTYLCVEFKFDNHIFQNVEI